MSTAVTVIHAPGGGYVVMCTACGKVARRELVVDADAKAKRHAADHLHAGQEDVEVA